MSKDNYILFHSSKCLHSKEFLQLLYKDPQLNQKVTKVNVDNQNIKLPAYVKSVPTLIITENQKPSLLVGSKIFDWYKNLHKKESQNNQIQDWDPSTMTGYSDGFSYLEGSDAMKKSFSFLESSDKIFTPDEKNYGQDSNDSGPKTQLDQDYEKFMSSRTNEVPSAPQRLS
jgi:hypothetical protein